MNEKPLRDRRPEGRISKSERARVAARDPEPKAKNRPGFDLGGAVGDAKPDDKNRVKKSTMQSQDAVKKKAGRALGVAKIETQGRTSNAPDKKGKVRSAVAGVRNWLRGK